MVSRENFTKSRFFTKSTVTKSGLCCSTSCNYQTGRYWQLWSNLPFLIPIPIGNWYSLCSVTASWPTPLEKVWNVSNYKREQRLKSLKIYEFWKSKNLEYLENQNILKILKIKISWKSMNFENLRSIRIMPKGIIMKNCERTTTKTRIQRCKSASSLSSRLKIGEVDQRFLNAREFFHNY